MEVINPRAGFVSIHEALEHFRSIKTDLDPITQSHAQKRLREEAEKINRQRIQPTEEETSSVGRYYLPGLQLVVDEAIGHMERPELSITRQTLEANETLSRGLQALDKFTKIEILQIMDLSPRTDVELYVIVEELYTRLEPDQIAHVLDLVRSSLSAEPVLFSRPAHQQSSGGGARVAPNGLGTMEGDGEEDDDWAGGDADYAMDDEAGEDEGGRELDEGDS